MLISSVSDIKIIDLLTCLKIFNDKYDRTNSKTNRKNVDDEFLVDLFRACLGYDWGMFRVCLGVVLGMFWVCFGLVLN